MAEINITLPDDIDICKGKQITFKVPDGFEFDNNEIKLNINTKINKTSQEYEYILLDSNLKTPPKNSFSSGALISVILDTDTNLDTNTNYAYLLNGSNREVYKEYTLLSEKWNKENNSYSFEDEYNSLQCDIEISISNQAKVEQIEAFNAALICGSSTQNIITAKSNAPTTDIPIIIKVRYKSWQQ